MSTKIHEIKATCYYYLKNNDIINCLKFINDYDEMTICECSCVLENIYKNNLENIHILTLLANTLNNLTCLYHKINLMTLLYNIYIKLKEYKLALTIIFTIINYYLHRLNAIYIENNDKIESQILDNLSIFNAFKCFVIVCGYLDIDPFNHIIIKRLNDNDIKKLKNENKIIK